ncbi:hypothetical protein AW168_16235 [Nocardia brasiliensis]|nr:hypothetical protein AW168_16235 [Nocardia brasiliensis]
MVAMTEIRPMQRTDLAAACDVLGLAFADNPNALAVTRGDRARAARLMRAGARLGKLGRAAATVLVAERAGQVVGVLNAAPWPRCQFSAAEQLRLAPRMIVLLGTRLPRAVTAPRVMAGHDPRQPHWHIGPIGVRPDQQGQGIGRRLLTAFLAKVDAERMPAFLETDVARNVLLYQSFGFETIARARIHDVDNHFMWRAGQADSRFSRPTASASSRRWRSSSG